MKRACIFPGQGSQKIGMGKALSDSFIESRKVFEEVDSALGFYLSKIMWEGSQEDLTLTENTQPALMAVSIATLRALESCGFFLEETISFLAGHSLGEYSALAASGVFSVGDTAKLLRIRGKAMQTAVPIGHGSMAAIIGLSYETLEDLCKKFDPKCQIANDNGAGQFVLSGLTKIIVEEVIPLCLEKGAKRAVLLPVSAPFHSSFMEPAAIIMEEALKKSEKNSPNIPVISNVTVSPFDTLDSIVSNLTKQVTSRVRWRETMEFFAANQVTSLYEIGSGNVLSSLARRMDLGFNSMAVGTPESVKEAIESIMK